MEDKMEEKLYQLWFMDLTGIGDVKRALLLGENRSAAQVYEMDEAELRQINQLTEKDRDIILKSKNLDRAKKIYEKMGQKGISFVTLEDSFYPKRLRTIPSAPYILFVKGRLPEDIPSVAIVGARECSAYGREAAQYLGETLAREGVQIISGMARGIDGHSQRGAVKYGKTFAVLGNGVDICYPREQIELYMEIQKQGGILSEQLPGKPPFPGAFPLRNRIISGLSDLLVVVEAKERSGSLITVNMALEQGKDVFAVPGRVNDPLSIGCNRLIEDGAGIVLSPESILSFLHINRRKIDFEKKFEILLASKEKLLYSCLDLIPKSLDVIQKETSMNFAELLETILSLELKEYIEETTKNHFRKKNRGRMDIHGGSIFYGEVSGDSGITCKS